MVKIRKAKKEDIKKIAEIFRLGYNAPPHNKKWTSKAALNTIRFYFKGNVIYVAEINKKIVGFIIFCTHVQDDGLRGHIEEIVVLKKHQGRGVGQELLIKAEEYFKKIKAKKISLMSVKTSKAFQIYKKKGYEVQKDFVSMIKKLK